MFNIGKNNKFSEIVSAMAGLFLIKSFIKKKNNLKQRVAKLKRTESTALSRKTLSNF